MCMLSVEVSSWSAVHVHLQCRGFVTHGFSCTIENTQTHKTNLDLWPAALRGRSRGGPRRCEHVKNALPVGNRESGLFCSFTIWTTRNHTSSLTKST